MSALLTQRQILARRGPRQILGANGRPLQPSAYLYPSPRSNTKQYRTRQQLQPTTRQNVTETDRLEMVNYSRQLYAQIGDVSTAIDQKNAWAFGDAWEPHYVGDQKAWGEEAEEWLKNVFYPTCNIRGPIFHFTKTLDVSGKAWDYDGDDLMVLTESEGHFPQVAIYPSTMVRSHYIGSGYGRAHVVQGGAYDGARMFDGVIYNRNNRAIAVRLWDEDGKSTDISLFSADLAYEPSWSDQGRGVPRLSTCLLRWMDLQDIDHFLQKGMKRAATMQIKRFTPDGESVGAAEIIEDEQTIVNGDGDEENRTVHQEMVGDGGDVIELSAEDGEDIQILEYRNPHPNSEAFVERIKRECLASVGWFYELLNLESSGRATSRLVTNLANKSIWARQAVGERRARRMVNYAIAKAMKEGFISKNNNGPDPYKWEFGLPAELTVDQGNDEQASREALKMGMTSKKIEAQKKGYRAASILKDRLEEIDELAREAEAMAAKFKWLTPDRAMELLEQRSPNPIVQQPQKPQAKPNSSDQDKSK